MARLTVRLHGQEVADLKLESGKEYIAGRAPDVQIPLANERGISRHHLKLYERDGTWVAEALSKFVLIQVGSQSVEVIELAEAQVFMVPPYEFHFEPTAAEPKPADEAKPSSDNLPAFYQPRVGAGAPAGGDLSEQTSPRVNNEATVAGSVTLVPYFKISYPNSTDDEVLKLEGHLWVAGRDPGCEIPIDSPHISRKHFELARTKEGFFVTDLGSSNGTKLNGNRIPPHEPTRLDSGDELRVMNVVMVFEIRDTHFNNRLENLPVPAFDPVLSAPPMAWPMDGYADVPTNLRQNALEEIPADWKRLRPHHLKKVDWKKNKVRMALIVLIPLVLILALTPTKPKEQAPDPKREPGSVVFANLTPEQKNVVKDSFNLARNLYVQGKYELCLTELAKVHELIPQYENSKELQSFCEQGKELVHRQRDLERKERERAMIEQQITSIVEGCKAKLNVSATIDETRLCLAEAIELDPEHHLITELIHTAQMREEEQKFLKQQKDELDRKAANGEAHYRRVKAECKKSTLAKCIVQYKKFLDSVYPRIDDEKSAARRELANVEKELKVKVETSFNECKNLGGKNKYREAYVACDKAVDEEPDNSEVKKYRDSMLAELRREMKSIYEDSVLEESLGQVDSAKEKWKKIMKEDLEFDDYYTKSKSKLQKYGLGGP